MDSSSRLENITRDQIRQVLNDLPVSRDSRSMVDRFELDENHHLKRTLCLRLYASVQDPVGHFTRIDKAFAPLVIGRFNMVGKGEPFVSKDAVRTTLSDSLIKPMYNLKFCASASHHFDTTLLLIQVSLPGR